MRKNNRPLILAWILFLISEVFAILILLNLMSFEYSIWKEENIKKSAWNKHVLIMAGTMIILNGHGMVIFRLFPRCRTLTVKYIHMLIHTITLVGAIYAYFDVHTFMSDHKHPEFSFEHIHTYLGILTSVVYICQYIASIFVYLYLYSSQKRRKLFAGCHNFLGICILQLSIATACVQLQEMDYEIDFKEKHAEIAIICMVLYGMAINSIILNPYLEWRLVGPI